MIYSSVVPRLWNIKSYKHLRKKKWVTEMLDCLANHLVILLNAYRAA